MRFQFSTDAWSEYIDWQSQDRRTLKRINDLLQDISRGGYQGLGKPECPDTGAAVVMRKAACFPDTGRVCFRLS